MDMSVLFGQFPLSAIPPTSFSHDTPLHKLRLFQSIAENNKGRKKTLKGTKETLKGRNKTLKGRKETFKGTKNFQG